MGASQSSNQREIIERCEEPDDEPDDDDVEPNLCDTGIHIRRRLASVTESEISCDEQQRLTAVDSGASMQDQAEDDDVSYCEYHDFPPPPDGGYGWVIVFASFICNMIVDGIAYTFGVFLPEFVSYYQQGKGTIAWVGSLLSGMYLMEGPIVSALTNKYGCRAVCIAGSLIASSAFVLSTLSPSVNTLMLTYGFLGGVGFGLIYLPAVVCVGYYFETKRSLATGIAVCGSGVGTFAFAPLARYLIITFGWKGANIILAGLILNCAAMGALMRPLRYPKTPKVKPLLQRMAEEKRIQMERGSIGGSYFMVQLPDGSMEKRQKIPLNIDPGVHSSFNLDQLVPGTPINAIPTVPTLPTITESKVQEYMGSEANLNNGNGNVGEKVEPVVKSSGEMKTIVRKVSRSGAVTLALADERGVAPRLGIMVETGEFGNKVIPRNASQPAFTQHVQGLPKNGSVPFFDRIRKTSMSERFRPTLGAIQSESRGNMASNGDVRKSSTHLRPNFSNASFTSQRNNNYSDDYNDDSVSIMSSTQRSTDKPLLVRPMSRKDIFYSGSVVNLPDYQSQKSLTNYRQSQLSLTRGHGREFDYEKPVEQYDLCPCFVLPESFKAALSTMMDFSLLKDPVFMMISLSNVFGMAGLYVPFVYLVDAAKISGIDGSSASFLISIIGITNTVGRIACGYVADFPWVNSLLLNNICLIVCTVSVAVVPLCQSYSAYVTMSIFFGLAVSGYISLTSIILVDLLGLEKLTNAFGLLILFRGAAAIIGSPLAGAIYDATNSYAIPFFVAGLFFAISTITSFLAPALKRCSSSVPPEVQVEDALAPIDEDEEEEDAPITMGRAIPEITETAPSPSVHERSITEQKSDEPREIKQIESVL